MELQCWFSAPIGRSCDHMLSLLSRRKRQLGGITVQYSASWCWSKEGIQALPLTSCPFHQTTKLPPAAAELPKTLSTSARSDPETQRFGFESRSNSINIKITVLKMNFVPMFACKRVKQTNKQHLFLLTALNTSRIQPLESNLRTTQVSFLSGEKMEPLNAVLAQPFQIVE